MERKRKFFHSLVDLSESKIPSGKIIKIVVCRGLLFHKVWARTSPLPLPMPQLTPFLPTPTRPLSGISPLRAHLPQFNKNWTCTPGPPARGPFPTCILKDLNSTDRSCARPSPFLDERLGRPRHVSGRRFAKESSQAHLRFSCNVASMCSMKMRTQ